MNDNVDLLATLLQILEAYILLDANLVVQVCDCINAELDCTNVVFLSYMANRSSKCSRKSSPHITSKMFSPLPNCSSNSPTRVHGPTLYTTLSTSGTYSRTSFQTKLVANYLLVLLSAVNTPHRSTQALWPSIYAFFRVSCCKIQMCLFSLFRRAQRRTKRQRVPCLKGCSTSGGIRYA